MLFFGFLTSSFFRHSSFVIRHCQWSLVLGPWYEVSRSHGLLVRRRDTGGDPVLSAQAQAPGASGFQHLALAEISGRNSGQRPLPTAAPKLAADPPIADARPGDPRAGPPLFLRQARRRQLA